MIGKQRILALIPARGGSKGLKDKNIRILGSLPLIAHTILSAKNSKYVDEIVVTTDSKKIRDVAIEYGANVPFLRPEELARDTARTIDAVIHAIDSLSQTERTFDILLLLQPTQPLRASDDIDNAILWFEKSGADSLVSVSEVSQHPILIRSIVGDRLKNLINTPSTLRRQDMKKYYIVNGAIYINKIKDIDINTSFNDNVVPYIMESKRAIDIDDAFDLFLAEQILKYNK